MNKHENNSQKDGGISPLGGIATVAMSDAAELVKYKNQSNFPLV